MHKVRRGKQNVKGSSLVLGFQISILSPQFLVLGSYDHPASARATARSVATMAGNTIRRVRPYSTVRRHPSDRSCGCRLRRIQRSV